MNNHSWHRYISEVRPRFEEMIKTGGKTSLAKDFFPLRMPPTLRGYILGVAEADIHAEIMEQILTTLQMEWGSPPDEKD